MRISDWSSDVCSSDLAAFEGDDDAPFRRPALIGRPAPYQLDRGLVGFGTRVAQKYALRKTRFIHQGLCQTHRRLGMEHVAGVPEFFCLRMQRCLPVGVAMAKRIDRKSVV